MRLPKNKKKLNSTTIRFTWKSMGLDGKITALNLNIQLDCQPTKND